VQSAYRPYWPHGVPLRRRKRTPVFSTPPAVFFGHVVNYEQPINRENCGVRVRFRGGKAATWTVRFRIVDAADENKWVRFDVGALSGLSYTLASVADIGGTPSETGPGGAPDFRAIGALEVDTGNSASAPGDFADFDDLEWFGGSLNGVVLDAGDLVNQEQGDPYWPTDDALEFWAASDAADFWLDTNFLPGIYEFEVTPDAGSVPCDLRIEINDDVGVDYFLEYKVGDRFVLFPGLLPVATTDPLRFRLRMAGGSVQGRVTDLSVISDVEDESEFLDDVAIAATGTVRLPITKSYRSIRQVQIALLNVGGAKSWVLIDKDPVNGPAIEVYNAAGTRVAGEVDADIQGVKGQ
jgi:hypothetical protein